MKKLGNTMVRGAIPPDLLKEIQNASDRKMNEQIARMGRDFRNTSNRFDLYPFWQGPSFRQLVNPPKLMPTVRGYMERYGRRTGRLFGAGHGHCLINDTSYHTNTPNLNDRVRKVIWALYARSRTPI